MLLIGLIVIEESNNSLHYQLIILFLPPAHAFYLCKLEISEIIVLDYYGGPHFVTKDDYFKADPDELFQEKTLTD